MKQKQHFLLHPTGEVLTRYKRSYTLSAVPHLSRLLGKMFGLTVTVIFVVIGMSFGQECDPLGERIDCGNLSCMTTQYACTLCIERLTHNGFCAVGYIGIDKTECEDARGCCWNDEKKVSIQPWESPYCIFGTVAQYPEVFFTPTGCTLVL